MIAMGDETREIAPAAWLHSVAVAEQVELAGAQHDGR